MSTNEERAQMLYDKALAELNTYLENLKTKPPQEIINSAYQIVNKQDLLMIFVQGRSFMFSVFQTYYAIGFEPRSFSI